jgi:hypothetical protein
MVSVVLVGSLCRLWKVGVLGGREEICLFWHRGEARNNRGEGADMCVLA